MKRLLLLMPTTTYRADDFVAAADRLGAIVVAGSNRCHVLAELGAVATRGDSLVLDFLAPESAAETIVAYARERPIDGVVATDDQATVIAALAASALGLRSNDPAGARAARDKLALRDRLARAGVRQARYVDLDAALDPAEAAERAASAPGFPCVLKPRHLSASRGVIRADDRAGFAEAYARVGRILRDPEVRARGGELARSVLVESFVPGMEVAVEGLLDRGRLTVLAIFDKPDPLDGPFFEETIYLTPSRLSPAVQADIAATTAAAAAALPIVEGPVHAELRINGDGAHLVELAPRSIGGLCARTLRFGLGMSLEELIIRHALGLERPAEAGERRAAGVMMLPIARTGMLRGVGGLEAARAVRGIEDVVITAPTGREIIALPEGSSYLGFAFARADTAEAVEAALREAHARLDVDIAPSLTTYPG